MEKAKLYSYCPNCKKEIYNGSPMYRLESSFYCSEKCVREVSPVTVTDVSFFEYIAG